ncbi:MAG: SDR family oxidoreductase [Nannocystaceae bacterium]|nr:SDR family oxidoreductase [Nannocystaceae bacterium]
MDDTDTAKGAQQGHRGTALVTGGAGFIGSHLCDRLLAEGWRVRVLDDLSIGRLSNLAHHEGNPALEFHRVDVADIAAVRPIVQGCQRVFHLAALADIVPSIESPLAYAHANVDGTMAVLEAARAAGVERFLYAASSSCYGIPEHYPTPEQAPCRPQYPYALTKYLGEQAVMHWGQVYGLPVVALRLFNVYGPRARTSGTYGAMFGVFLAQRLAGKPYTVVGDGSQSRDFTYVTDVVDAFVCAAESSICGVAMNVGTGRPVAVADIVRLLGGPVVHLPKRPGEPDRTHADTGLIERLLGWHAKVGIEEGVARLLSHIDDWRDAPVWTPESIAVATDAWFRHLGAAAHGGRNVSA